MTAQLIKATADRNFGRKFIRAHVALNERAVRFSRGNPVALLGPGTYTSLAFLTLANGERIATFDTTTVKFTHPLLEQIVKLPGAADELEVLNLADDERALVFVDGRLIDIAGPGLHAYWKADRWVRVERFNVDDNDGRLTHPKLAAIIAQRGAGEHITALRVDDEEAALVFRDGRLVEQVGPGLHAYWTGGGKITWKDFDLREKTQDVSGQEIMTADKVSLRVNLVVTYRIADVLAAARSSNDADGALYREAQLVLRKAIGAKSLDELLADKRATSDEVRDALAERADGLGLAVKSVGLRDVILPGDMRELFNAVIAAHKESEANLIRRREETAAARSQANTARLLADNPQLAKLRELELLRDVLAGTDLRIVLGGTGADDNVAEKLRKQLVGA
ncbi:MAG: slipin family protein [Planctomycetota bacterium]